MTSELAMRSSKRSGTSRGSSELKRTRGINRLWAIISNRAVRSIFGREILPVTSEMDSRQNDFLVAGIGKHADLLQDFAR